MPGTTGRFETSVKTTTETTGIGSDTLKIKREVFGNGPQGPLSLIETSVADQQNFADGRSRTTTNTWAPDAGGRLNLASREVKETKSIGGDVRQTETTRYLPTISQPLGESERILTTERRVRPDLVQTETQRTVRDPNGQWQTTETRNQEVRTVSRGEVVEEETVRNVDTSGQLNLSEKTVTRRTTNNGSDQVVTEVYSPYITGVVQSGNSLTLNQRLRVTTKPTTNGGSQIISETEAPDPSEINGRVRVVARTVETVRQVAPDVWETQRQTFTLDGSGRLVLTSEDSQQTKGK